MDPCNGGDLLCSQEGVYPVPRRGRREAGAGYGRCSVQVGGGDPQDPLRVAAGRDDEEEQGGARALLPESLPPVVGTPGPGEGGGEVWVGPAAGCVRRRREGGAPGGLSGECLAHDGVRRGWAGAVVHRVGRAGAGGRLVRAFHEYRDFAHLQVLVRRMWKVECRVQIGHFSWVCGSRLVQVRGRVPGAAPPEGVQQGWGAAVEGHGGPRARQPQGVPHGQGPA